jgi:probable HAF family extracellular repeat protein
MMDLGTLGGSESFAAGINGEGQVVGYADTIGGALDAFLYSGGIMTDLNSLLPANSGWRLESASAINDSGQIVGYGINPEGQTHAFLLDTSPEPASVVLFGAGAALLVLMRKRLCRYSAQVNDTVHND